MTVNAPVPSKSAVELFAFFSRFEFALKEAGFFRAHRSEGVKPDWPGFARLAGVWDVMEHLKGDATACKLFGAPPQRQVVCGDVVTWADAPAVGDAQGLIDAIKRVRNNLFHGGKSGADPRDDELCSAATVALRALLEVDDRVRAAFLGQY